MYWPTGVLCTVVISRYCEGQTHQVRSSLWTLRTRVTEQFGRAGYSTHVCRALSSLSVEGLRVRASRKPHTYMYIHTSEPPIVAALLCTCVRTCISACLRSLKWPQKCRPKHSRFAWYLQNHSRCCVLLYVRVHQARAQQMWDWFGRKPWSTGGVLYGFGSRWKACPSW